jgi:hypothetical protein
MLSGRVTQFEPSWERWLKLRCRSTFRRLPAEQATGIDWRKAYGTKDHPVWASVPIETGPSKYDLVVVLLALNPIRVYESIILSGIAGTEYGRFKFNPIACPQAGLPSLSWAATR